MSFIGGMYDDPFVPFSDANIYGVPYTENAEHYRSPRMLPPVPRNRDNYRDYESIGNVVKRLNRDTFQQKIEDYYFGSEASPYLPMYTQHVTCKCSGCLAKKTEETKLLRVEIKRLRKRNELFMFLFLFVIIVVVLFRTNLLDTKKMPTKVDWNDV